VPTGAGTGTKMVSLYQIDATAVLLKRRINWHLANDAAVVVVEGCDYAAGA
jgi:hypothetical protein